jgi:hypothetical protein
MKKPVCRLCGTAHYLREGCPGPPEEDGDSDYIFEPHHESPVETNVAREQGDPQQAEGTEQAKDGQEVTSVSTDGSGQASTERVKRWRERHREAYNEYQREYMRRRRASGS